MLFLLAFEEWETYEDGFATGEMTAEDVVMEG